MSAPKEFRVRQGGPGRWYCDEVQEGRVIRDFRRYPTEAEALEAARVRERDEERLRIYLRRRAAAEEGL